MGQRSERLAARLAVLALYFLVGCSGAPQATPLPATATAPLAATVAPTATARVVASPAVTRPAAAPTATVVASATPGAPTCAPGVELLGFSDALDKARFGGTEVGGLSALVYDAARDVYYALVDNQGDTVARFYTLRLPLDGGKPGTPAIEAVTILRDANGQPFTGRNFDGEGMALVAGDQLLIASETEPSIRRFWLDGRLIDELMVPERFLVKPKGEATANQAFEGLALSPDRLSLFAAVEGPLAADGFAGLLQGRLRLLRYTSRPPFLPSAQYYYRAESAQGVADLLAPDSEHLLVLERGFLPGAGNTVRIYRAALTGATDVFARPTLADPDLIPLEKELLVDLAACPPGAATHPARQPTPLLDNFEALALGPALPDGRRLLWLLSDDNFGADQVTRLIALAWGP